MVRSIMEQLIESGQVNRGQLGVTTLSLTPEFRKSLGLADNAQGALVSQVCRGLGGRRAGIEAGDVITSVRGQPIRTNTELRNTIGMLKVGDSIEIGLLREGKPQSVTAVLREPAQLSDASSIHPSLAGAELVEASEDSAGGVRIRAVAAGQPGRTGRPAGGRPHHRGQPRPRIDAGRASRSGEGPASMLAPTAARQPGAPAPAGGRLRPEPDSAALSRARPTGSV